jgi:polyphosphate kinase
VEVITPIEKQPLRQRLWDLLVLLLNDQRQSWDLKPDGTYVQRKPEPGREVGVHQLLMNQARQQGAQMIAEGRIGAL